MQGAGDATQGWGELSHQASSEFDHIIMLVSRKSIVSGRCRVLQASRRVLKSPCDRSSHPSQSITRPSLTHRGIRSVEASSSNGEASPASNTSPSTTASQPQSSSQPDQQPFTTWQYGKTKQDKDLPAFYISLVFLPFPLLVAAFLLSNVKL